MLLPSTPVDSAVPHSSACDAARGQSQNTEPGVPAKEKVRRDSTLIERAQLRGENVENCNPINNALVSGQIQAMLPIIERHQPGPQ